MIPRAHPPKRFDPTIEHCPCRVQVRTVPRASLYHKAFKEIGKTESSRCTCGEERPLEACLATSYKSQRPVRSPFREGADENVQQATTFTGKADDADAALTHHT